MFILLEQSRLNSIVQQILFVCFIFILLEQSRAFVVQQLLLGVNLLEQFRVLLVYFCFVVAVLLFVGVIFLL